MPTPAGPPAAPTAAALEKVLLIAPKGDPLEDALRLAQAPLQTPGLMRVDGHGAMLDGLLRGRDWDGAVVVAREARATAEVLAALREADPRLPVLVVAEGDAATAGPVWRTLGARLVVDRSELREPAAELQALQRQVQTEVEPPLPRDADDGRVLVAAITDLLRTAATAADETLLALAANGLRRTAGAALVETWRPEAGSSTLMPGPAAADDPLLHVLREQHAVAERPRDALVRWVAEHGLAVSVPDLGPGRGAGVVVRRRAEVEPDAAHGDATGEQRIRFLRHEAAWSAGLRAVHALPLRIGGEVAAVFLIGWRESDALADGAARAGWLLALLAPTLHWRRRAEAAAVHDALAERAWSALSDGAAACDAAGRLTLRTRAAERLGFAGRVGDPADRWRAAWRLTDLDDRPLPPGGDPLSRALAGATLTRARFVGESSEGRRRTLLVDAAPVTDAGGAVAGAVVVLRDAEPEAVATAQLLAATESSLTEFRSLLDRAADLAAALGEAATTDDLWGPLDGFLQATTPATAWRVRRGDGAALGQRGEPEAAGAQLVSGLRVGEHEIGTLELHAPPNVTFDERHGTAAVMAANLLAVALDHADLVVQERDLRRQAEETALRLRALFDTSPAAVALVALDDGTILDLNAALETLLGRPRDALLGARSADLGAWADPEERGEIERDVHAGTPVRDREVRLLHRDGSERRCLAAAEPTELGGRPAMLLTLLDVTERLAREAQLAQLANFRETLMGFVEETLEQGFEGAFYQRLVEAAVRATPGAEAGSLLLRDEDDAFRFAAAVGYEAPNDPLGEGARPQRGIADSLTVPIHLDGRRVATLTLDSFADHEAFGDASRQLAHAFAAQAATLVKRRALERELERLAYHDSLTGLPNRALMRDRLGQAIARSVRTGRRGAALFIDLDNLKVINDALGHTVGDALLTAVAQRLRTSVRADDTVARVGGDEFVVLLPEVRDADAAATVAEKLLGQLRHPFEPGGHELHVSASIGIVLFPDDAIDADVLIQHGDTAMYQAKAQGKDRFRFFTREMNRVLLERAALEAQLRKALERDQLSLHYQPRVSLRDGTITSVEALARWAHPERGWIPPGAFIPVAEDAGLINALGRRLLEEACRQARAWLDEGCGVVVAFNLSAKQLQERDVVAQVEEVLAVTGLEGRWLELELTESAVMRNVEENVGKLVALRRLGVHVSIDDFGTAYSSLNYLKRLPASALKVDRSFVVDLGDDPDATPHDAAIVRAVVALAHTLGMAAIAEGIETPAQLAFLRQLGCEQGQGYLFARPAPADEVGPLLRRGRVDLPAD